MLWMPDRSVCDTAACEAEGTDRGNRTGFFPKKSKKTADFFETGVAKTKRAWYNTIVQM